MDFLFSVSFLDKWQTLIGAALGPFLAVILSAIGFWIKSILENKRERKEHLRRIEIGITRSLSDIYVVEEQLRLFADRLQKLATEAKNISDPKEFFLNIINFPAIREIYRDPEMMSFKIKSYYLHNKILFADAGIKHTNETNRNLKNDFESLLSQNELLVALLSRKLPSESGTNTADLQRQTYADNLENFAKAINDYISQCIRLGIKTMAQIKIYNDLIRKRWGWITLWRQEGINLKYFRNKKEYENFARNLDSMDRIDLFIEKNVKDIMTKAETRKNKIKTSG